MKNYCIAMALCGCLLIGSLYPKLLLDHHVKLVNEAGIEQDIETNENFEKEIPVRVEFRILKLFR